ncbi:hypothetical protein K488DRAFT_81646 [Vararia minispora EC-137]|uniref:Uncharacterized protein n=1 Tax=Vararia minispora EC-137 TaxID=1314806 RepID=A0ACB8QZ25_9AGAM|nr:hypothetical protein K488DRAFT_81646 [Vararia minispora EC-137]
MNSITVASILLFIVPMFALVSTATRVLSLSTPSQRSLPFFFLALAIAFIATTTGVLGVLQVQDPRHPSTNFMVGHDVSSACLKLLAGCATLYLIQEPSLLKGLAEPFNFYTRQRVISFLLLPAVLLFTSAGVSVAAAVRQSDRLTNVARSLLTAYFVTTFFSLGALLCSRKTKDELRSKLMWFALVIAQVVGVLVTTLEFSVPSELVVRTLFEVIWLVLTILVLQVFATPPPPTVLRSPVQCVLNTKLLGVPTVTRKGSPNHLSTASRIHRPSSPMTPTEDYLRDQDPFASPPPSTCLSCSFGDTDLEKLARSSMHDCASSDLDHALPTLVSPPLPRRGFAPTPLPTFPPELKAFAQVARDSSTATTHSLKDLPSTYHVLEMVH